MKNSRTKYKLPKCSRWMITAPTICSEQKKPYEMGCGHNRTQHFRFYAHNARTTHNNQQQTITLTKTDNHINDRCIEIWSTQTIANINFVCRRKIKLIPSFVRQSIRRCCLHQNNQQIERRRERERETKIGREKYAIFTTETNANKHRNCIASSRRCVTKTCTGYICNNIIVSHFNSNHRMVFRCIFQIENQWEIILIEICRR